MSRKIVVAVIVINLMFSAVAQAHLVRLSQRLQSHQMHAPDLATTPHLPAYRVGSNDLISDDILIVADRRERRQRFRNEVRRDFRGEERRERRKRERRREAVGAAIGGAIIGGIIAGAIQDKKRRERRRDVIEHHHSRPRPRRNYGY